MRHLVFSHVAVFVVAAAVLRIGVVPQEHCPPFEPVAARAAVADAADWLIRGVRPDGRYLYGYDRAHDLVSSSYNATRHAGVTMGLYRLAAAGDPSGFAAAEAGLRYIRANLVRHDEWAAFSPPGDTVSIGPSALAVAALAHRRIATGDSSQDELMRELSRFLVSQQQPDGSILANWDGATEKPVPNMYAKFGTGEALWALALMHRLFPEEHWEEPALRLARFVATRRDEVEGYFLPFSDHWAAYGLAELGPCSARARGDRLRATPRRATRALDAHRKPNDRTGTQPDRPRREHLGRRAGNHRRGARTAPAALPG